MTAGAFAAMFFTLVALEAEQSQNDKRERDVQELRTRGERRKKRKAQWHCIRLQDLICDVIAIRSVTV